jgi:hypothetical protein
MSPNSNSGLNWPIVFDDGKGGRIPERQVNSATENIEFKILGAPVEITGGFMEPHGHGPKGTTYAIFGDKPQTIQTLSPANRNIGIDYVVQTKDQATSAWYSGIVESAGLEGGYGNRVHVKTDINYTFNGKEYPVYTAYAHLDNIKVQTGQRVHQGQNIGEMGGTGSGGVTRHPEHVDLQTYIKVDGKIINVSPNAIQEQFLERTKKQVKDGVEDVIRTILGPRSELQIENNEQQFGQTNNSSRAPDLAERQQTYNAYAEFVRPALASNAPDESLHRAISYTLAQEGYPPQYRAEVIVAGMSDTGRSQEQDLAYVRGIATWPEQRQMPQSEPIVASAQLER